LSFWKAKTVERFNAVTLSASSTVTRIQRLTNQTAPKASESLLKG